jgi:hypothetical protein
MNSFCFAHASYKTVLKNCTRRVDEGSFQSPFNAYLHPPSPQRTPPLLIQPFRIQPHARPPIRRAWRIRCTKNTSSQHTSAHEIPSQPRPQWTRTPIAAPSVDIRTPQSLLPQRTTARWTAFSLPSKTR